MGAEVEVFWGSNKQVQQVTSASGFSAQNQRPLLFGLGEANQVEKVIISWPSGKVDTMKAPKINTTHTIIENKFTKNPDLSS
jgi:hypothetical protein